MSKILLISQNENDTWFVNGLSIGVRQPRIVVGTKIKELLKEKNVSEEDFTKAFETNYHESLGRVLEDREIPKEKLFNKIVDYFKVDKDIFYDKELQNVIVNDSRMVVGEYSTEKRAREVKKQIDDIIIENFKIGKPIVVQMPKE